MGVKNITSAGCLPGFHQNLFFQKTRLRKKRGKGSSWFMEIKIKKFSSNINATLVGTEAATIPPFKK